MARQYKVKGTNTYLIWAIVLALICIWAIKDGWFPSPSKIARHGSPDSPNLADHFYAFNHSLAYLSGVGSLVCAIVHNFVK